MTRLAFAALLLGNCASACSSRQEPESLQLLRFVQSGKEDVFLNEKLVFKCSDALDPFSITRESLSILAEDGTPALGRFWVNGSEIEFLPEPPIDPALRGGGFRPGASYEVAIAGFPRIHGLRALNGKILPESRRFRFRVVDPGKLPAGVRSPFLDESPGVAFAVQDVSREPRLAQPLTVGFNKPLRPDCLQRKPFRLYEGSVPGQGEEISVECLVASARETNRVEIRPDWSRIRAGTIYRIELDAAKLLDLGGNALATDYFRGNPIFTFQFLP